MVQRRQEPGLALETQEPLRIATEDVGQQLDLLDEAEVQEVPSGFDLHHAADCTGQCAFDAGLASAAAAATSPMSDAI
jgi:hypothetical protein